MKRRSYERWYCNNLASPASMLFGGGSNRRSGSFFSLCYGLSLNCIHIVSLLCFVVSGCTLFYC